MSDSNDYDPQHEDFDPYKCWEDVNCDYVEEECFGCIDDDDYEEFLCCGAPDGFVCPLYAMKVNKDLRI